MPDSDGIGQAGTTASAVAALCQTAGGAEEVVLAGVGESVGVPGREALGCDVERGGAREPSLPEDAKDGVQGPNATVDRGSAGAGPAPRATSPNPR